MIIGKFFESNNDYVNVMKTSKKYNQLVKMYHFNPISECELFENMETQYLLKRKDVKKQGMYQYVYWYHVNKELEENEIMKPVNAYKYVVNNMKKLE